MTTHTMLKLIFFAFCISQHLCAQSREPIISDREALLLEQGKLDIEYYQKKVVNESSAILECQLIGIETNRSNTNVSLTADHRRIFKLDVNRVLRGTFANQDSVFLLTKWWSNDSEDLFFAYGRSVSFSDLTKGILFARVSNFKDEKHPNRIYLEPTYERWGFERSFYSTEPFLVDNVNSVSANYFMSFLLDSSYDIHNKYVYFVQEAKTFKYKSDFLDWLSQFPDLSDKVFDKPNQTENVLSSNILTGMNNGLNVSIANPKLTSTQTGYLYDFDIMIANSIRNVDTLTYLNNITLALQYNDTALGNNLASFGKLITTKGAKFNQQVKNHSIYNVSVSNQNTNTLLLSVNINSATNVSNLTSISTISSTLLHLQIEFSNRENFDELRLYEIPNVTSCCYKTSHSSKIYCYEVVNYLINKYQSIY